jgi:DNA polymerase-3 subunit epsilon
MTNADTDDAMDFPEVWAEIASHIQGLPLVAHNSPFDESCLKAAFEAYDMEYPGYRFYCTCRASRKLLGDKLPNHQLQTVAAYCGYDLTKRTFTWLCLLNNAADTKRWFNFWKTWSNKETKI